MKENVRKYVDNHTDLIKYASDKIWELAELSFEEYESVKLYTEILRKEGFSITEELAGIPTAFKASFGSGEPRIGILAEYDALPNLSQKAGFNSFSPIENGASGHGCGHNLLGAASLGAVLSVRDYIKENNLKGTIEFYGCPAEENGNAKTFMARDGVFDKLDAAFTWHPETVNSAWDKGSLANVSTRFSFKGVTSHAAAAPHLGRSALDAAEIMNVGVNYLREHVIPEARIHYAYLDVGGTAPNVVQDSAKLHYFIRAPKYKQAQEIHKRVQDIAKGAALISGTEVEEEFHTGLSDFIPNPTLTELMQESMEDIGAPDFDDKDFEIARSFFNTLSKSEQDNIFKIHNYRDEEDIKEKPLHTIISPLSRSNGVTPGSTDVGDVSYVVPTAQVTVATLSLGTALHTWQATAQGKTSIALKGTKLAAGTMALSAIKVMENPKIAEQARKDLEKETGGVYNCPVPDHIQANSK